MNILFIISQSLSVFIPSFTDEFNALDVCYTLFLVDERKNYTTQTQQIISYIEKYSFDRLLIINDLNKDGKFLLTESVLIKIPCYVWFVDSMQNAKFKNKNIGLYKQVYSFEPSDISFAANQLNIHNVRYLPLTAGQRIFCNKNLKTNFKYDVSFVGLVSGSQKRLDILDSVAKYCCKNKKKMIVYGHFWHNAHLLQSLWGAIIFRYRHPFLYKFVKNHKITPEQCALLYAETKVNLNIHISNHTGFNCRTFEILGNSNFELCDEQDNRSIKFINKKHLVFYRSIEELLKELDYYLNHENERQQIARSGENFVNSHYSLKKIMQQILL